jgi:NitT/TauT family transport system ATP-binding protein
MQAIAVTSDRPAPVAAAPHVSIERVSKTYSSERGDVAALTEVNLKIRTGEFISLLGPSGCGKSTLLKIIAGLETSSNGYIQIDGKALDGPPEGLGFVFQRDVLLDWRTVLGNMLLPAEFQNKRRKDYEARANELLALVGLRDFSDRYPWELSGGMRQRVAICRALLMNPDLLLMDEPFGALDALTRDELNLELQRMWLETGKTIVFVTHSISEAILLSDRIAVMAARPGRVVEILDVDFGRPRTLSLRESPEFSAYARRIREVFENYGLFKVEH